MIKYLGTLNLTSNESKTLHMSVWNQTLSGQTSKNDLIGDAIARKINPKNVVDLTNFDFWRGNFDIESDYEEYLKMLFQEKSKSIISNS